jgi:hypothetical protein
LLIEVLDERLGLVQLLRIPRSKFYPLDLLLGSLPVIAAGDLSVIQFAIRKGLHGDSYPFSPGGWPQEPCIAGDSHASLAVEQQNRAVDAGNVGANPFK